MKKMMMFAAVLAAVGMVAGCFTSATAYTEKTNPDGTKTVSRVSVIGTGDKASQVAAEGLFADGTQDDLGAGVKTASANQKSTGIDGTLKGVGDLLGGIAAVMRAYPAAGAVPASAERGYTYDTDPSYDTAPTGYTGSPGENGEGVYGNPACSRCRAYRAAHPEVEIINVSVASNAAAMWNALRERGYTGATVALPVTVTADGYTQSAK